MRWYVARTKAGREAQAGAVLAQWGVDTYLPWLRKLRPRAGRRAAEPLFPGYLFARLQVPSDQWLAARSAPAVAYFLGYGGQPVAVPEDFIPGLRARIDLLDHGGGLTRFKHGDRVIINYEMFQYLEAIFDRRLTPTGRVRVFVEFLHRQVAVNLPEDALKKTN